MAQQHMDRLSAVDATFLHQESSATHMHIGGLVILEGNPPTLEEFCTHIASRIHQVPRFRQKLAMAPYQTGRPLWIDDPRFDIAYHVRHTALPRPGTDAQLQALTERIISLQLDRTKPLWEMWLVEGLRGDRFAIISKTHHALVDGVSGADLLTVLFDLGPEYAAAPPSDWIPRPEPSRLELLAAGVRDATRLAFGATARVTEAVRHPLSLVSTARETAEGVGLVAWAGLNAAPSTPLNVRVGPHRRFRVVRGRLDDYKLIKNAFGGTVNDAVLAVVAGALARFLRHRGVRTEGLVLRSCVPVSVRSQDRQRALGNQITLLLAPLRMDIADPVARLAEARASMEGIKRSKQALGAKTIAELQRFAPPTILAVSSRIGMSSRMYNLLVTNVPGPQFPVYALGRRLLELAPVAFLAPDHALAIAIVSYNGGINFGILADADAVPDVDVVARGIDDSLRELVDLARDAAGDAVAASAATAEAADAPAAPRRRSTRSRASEGTTRSRAASSSNGRAAAGTERGRQRRGRGGGDRPARSEG